jgi:hypothetical protein
MVDVWKVPCKHCKRHTEILKGDALKVFINVSEIPTNVLEAMRDIEEDVNIFGLSIEEIHTELNSRGECAC